MKNGNPTDWRQSCSLIPQFDGSLAVWSYSPRAALQSDHTVWRSLAVRSHSVMAVLQSDPAVWWQSAVRYRSLMAVFRSDTAVLWQSCSLIPQFYVNLAVWYRSLIAQSFKLLVMGVHTSTDSMSWRQIIKCQFLSETEFCFVEFSDAISIN